MTRPAETTSLHTRLMKYTLELDSARTWWAQRENADAADVVERAFAGAWFGAKSLPRVRVLVSNLRSRFNAFPEALSVLRRWRDMQPGTRALIAHWHTQLTDPLYRQFTGEYLVARHDTSRGDVTRDMVIRWVGEHGQGRWTMASRAQLATQLMVTAKAAGLIENLKDPRRLVFPRVDDDALTYLLYLLRGTTIAGTLIDNPYLASVGLMPRFADERFRTLSALRFTRQGDLVDFAWVQESLTAWAAATVASESDLLIASSSGGEKGRGAA